MAIDLSFVDSDDNSDFEEHVDLLSRNDTETEHSDKVDHSELKAALEDIDFDEFKGMYEDLYEDSVTNV